MLFTKLFLNDMVKKNKGYILNTASAAAFTYGPLMSTYYATKSYVKSLTLGIAEEIKEMNFKTKMCARTIRNNIYSGEIYDIKPEDMIYKKIYKEKNKDKKICEKVPAEKSIDYRPEEANTREEYGHWEGDLVIGTKKRGSVLFTLTERMTRQEIIMKLPNKETATIAKALDKNPENKHLQNQLILLNRASITTIHSFCLDVIRNNFYEIDTFVNEGFL